MTRFERATPAFGRRRSVQLSYIEMVRMKGVEPPTFGSVTRCSVH